jgi:hypothetical protein
MEFTTGAWFTIKLEDNKEIQSKLLLVNPTSKDAWSRFNMELRKLLRDPQSKYVLQYCDDEGDKVTLTSQNEWEEMIRANFTINGCKEIFIFSPLKEKIEFIARNTQPIRLAGLKFYTWSKHESAGWNPRGVLHFDHYEQPFWNGAPLICSPIKEESLDGFQGVSIQWNSNPGQLHSGYLMFFHSSQLRVGNVKGKVYWPILPDHVDCIVFTGWLFENNGLGVRQHFKGAVVDIESIIQNQSSLANSGKLIAHTEKSLPLDSQTLEEARMVNRYINQLTTLWDIGHRDVKKNLYMLQTFSGNVTLVLANVNAL